MAKAAWTRKEGKNPEGWVKPKKVEIVTTKKLVVTYKHLVKRLVTQGVLVFVHV
jgi:hypothetical protein